MATQKNSNCPKSLVVVLKQTVSKKLVFKQSFANFFCMQNLIFCVHNVVLDTLMLGFSFRLIYIVTMLKTPISFLCHVFYVLINV